MKNEDVSASGIFPKTLQRKQIKIDFSKFDLELSGTIYINIYIKFSNFFSIISKCAILSPVIFNYLCGPLKIR
jgi:hypothetical protein